MKEEIKEYLDKSDFKFKDIDEDGNEIEMSLSEMIQDLLDTNKRLGDYITTLQEENKRLQFALKDTKENADEIICELKEENDNLKNGYCELKVKCNNGECDCTNEEYESMIQTNMRGSLLLDDYKTRIDKAKNILEGKE